MGRIHTAVREVNRARESESESEGEMQMLQVREAETERAKQCTTDTETCRRRGEKSGRTRQDEAHRDSESEREQATRHPRHIYTDESV